MPRHPSSATSPEPAVTGGGEPRVTLAALAKDLKRLEARVRALEAERGAEPSVSPPPLAPTGALAAGWEPSRAAALLGRACLVFGGAFLARAVTDAGFWPAGAGLLAGLAYAVAVLVVAHRAAERARDEAAVFAISAAVILYSLAWEAAIRFRALPAPAAAVLLAAAWIALLAFAAHHRLAPVAWGVALGGLTALSALALSARTLEAGLAALLAGTAASRVVAARCQWPGLAGPSLLAACLLASTAVLVAARPGGIPEAFAGLSREAVLLLCLALPALPIGGVVASVARGASPRAEDVWGAAFALPVGYGGAALVARAMEQRVEPLAGAALIVGALAYALAIRERVGGRPAMLPSLAGLVLVAHGSAVLAGPRWSPAVWALIALGLTRAPASPASALLAAHAGLFALGAAAHGGVAALARAGLRSSAGGAPLPDLATQATVVLLAAALVTLARAPGWLARGAALAGTLVLTTALLGAATVAGEGWSVVGPDPARQALWRTSVLVGGALAAAAGARRTGWSPLRWLTVALLGFAAATLLLEDLPRGRPATLFAALAVFGAALLVVPRWMRDRGAP